MQNLQFFLDSFEASAKMHGFVQREPTGLISDYFPSEFNLSAGHQHVIPVLQSAEPLKESMKISIIETCFRRSDLERIGYSPDHLLTFEMGVCAVMSPNASLSDLVEQVLDSGLNWLTEVGIKSEQLFFTYSLGANVFGEEIGEDTISLNALKKLSVPDKNRKGIYGRRNFIFSQGELRPAGHSLEIFHRNGNSFREIASVNIYTRLFRSQRLVQTVNSAVGIGMGFERVCAAVNKKNSVFLIDVFSPAMELMKRSIGDCDEYLILRPRLFLICELIKSICFVVSAGQLPDQSPRGRILKRLIKKVCSELNYIGFPEEETVDQCVDSFISQYSSRYATMIPARGVIKSMIHDLAT